ncbi:SWIM zinc finger family protein [Bradyrhizobium genosp. A]|uniref:SWIM zinc finger family protein n=1 Tax=Bradyrhizobium genosp. A TaxID=83626 RepID=UPI003CEBFC15
MLSDVLKRKEIYSYFSRAAMEKAHAYQAQGRVSGVKVSDDLTHVSSQVRGSESKKYRVDIQLEFDDDSLTDIDGGCSCPMAFNCKHVAATLLEALNGKAPPVLASEPVAQAAKPAKVQAPSAPPVLGYEVDTWIDSVGRAARSSDYAADESQRLLYCLHPSDGAMPYLAVSLR